MKEGRNEGAMTNMRGDNDEITITPRVQIFVICYFNPRITMRFTPNPESQWPLYY